MPLAATIAVAAIVAAATSGVVSSVAAPDAIPPSEVAALTADATDPADDDAGVPTTPSAGETMTVGEIAESVGPSVAAVEVRAGNAGQGQGSAVIVDPDGLLVTNNHVVDGADDIAVQLADGSRYDASLVGTDPMTDLAVLRIDAGKELPAAALSSELPDIGETAVAIGSPFGLDGSVSAGVVSALDRSLPAGDTTLTGLIQTDAAINPGNSGGALVNDRGEVIGINTAIISRSGTNGGVGFAVPSTTATDVADQLIQTGEVRRAILGVSGRDIDQQVAEAYGLDAETGPLIMAVEPGSGADEAGLQPGDVITGIDGERVRTMSELAARIREMDPDTVIEVTGIRDGETFSLEVRLGTA